MPNWADTRLVISGDTSYLDELEQQVAEPYETYYHDYKTGEEKTATENGAFLLWNIIRPTNLDAYYKRGEYADKPVTPVEDFDPQPIDPASAMREITERLQEALQSPLDEDLLSKIQREFATGMDWYNWNVRNWGTKWEISEDNSSVESRSDRELVYRLITAWSPPVEALDHLAKQYPSLTFTLMSLDENDLFALEIGWSDGERSYEMDLPITHEIHQQLRGYCWACEEGLEDRAFDDCDEDRASMQDQYGCRASGNVDLDVEFGLS